MNSPARTFSNRPMPNEAATGKQHLTIIKVVCYKIGEPWTRPPMEKIAAFINTNFNLNVDAELEPLTKREASNIIGSLLN